VRQAVPAHPFTWLTDAYSGGRTLTGNTSWNPGHGVEIYRKLSVLFVDVATFRWSDHPSKESYGMSVCRNNLNRNTEREKNRRNEQRKKQATKEDSMLCILHRHLVMA
jgi:hypothetical protein